MPEIEFEIPPRPSRGAEINTVEGFLVNSADNLQLGQPDRYVRARALSRGWGVFGWVCLCVCVCLFCICMERAWALCGCSEQESFLCVDVRRVFQLW